MCSSFLRPTCKDLLEVILARTSALVSEVNATRPVKDTNDDRTYYEISTTMIVQAEWEQKDA